jgi:hypothetical protein
VAEDEPLPEIVAEDEPLPEIVAEDEPDEEAEGEPLPEIPIVEEPVEEIHRLNLLRRYQLKLNQHRNQSKKIVLTATTTSKYHSITIHQKCP